MKASSTGRNAIDWPAVLGPILTTSGHGDRNAVPADELPTLEAAAFSHARRAVRPRPGLADSELPFEVEPVAWYPGGRFLLDVEATPAVRPGAFLQHAAGDYYIQDAGSMLALALADVRAGEWVCDTCAAPGGKSTGLLEALAGQGILLANEVIRSRLAILNLALARAGYGNHLITNLELEWLRQLCGRAFDCVLVDAPCTGQSLVARGKQSMAAFGPTQIAHSSARQQRILWTAAGLVKPAGRLVYSTCAFSFAENEQIVLAFIEQHPGWRLSSCDALEAWRSPLAAGCYRVWPHRQGCSGAFAALLVNDTDMSGVPSPDASSHRGHLSQPARSRWERLNKLPEAIDWLGPPGLLPADAQWWQSREQLHRFTANTPSAWIEAAVAGTDIAHCQSQPSAVFKTARWTPSYGASRLAAGPDALPQCTLDDQQAVRYVAGEAVRYAGDDSNWCVVTWRGRRLSWGKLTQGTLKNHFPKLLRQTAIVAPAGC